METCIGHLLVALLCSAQLTNCKSLSRDWMKLGLPQCLPEAQAVRVAETPSGIADCVLLAIAMDTSGLQVAQFDSDTRQCSLFQYTAVCRLIDGLAAAESSQSRRCAAFANDRAAKFLTLSRKFMLGVGSKLRAAWVMSDDADASRSNLVCGQTQQWMSENVEWSSEGAKLDGVSSKMWLENVEFASVKQGLTWLVRLKRDAKIAPLLQTYNCDSKSLGAALWDGSPTAWGLYFFRVAPSYSVFKTTLETNLFEWNKFVEVAVTSASPFDVEFFSKVGRVSKPNVVQKENYTIAAVPKINCIGLGFPPGKSQVLNGTVQAVAIMNDTMTEAEISSFFELVR